MYIKRKITAIAGVAAMSLMMVSCAGTTDVKSASDIKVKSIEFKSVKAPETDAEKRAVLASDTVTINGKEYKIGYNTILRSGESPKGNSANGTFGVIFDKDGKPIMNEDGSKFISNSNDFASLLKGKDGKLYMVSHFEESPGAMYVTELEQSKDGKLSAVKTRNIDYSDLKGGWVHCAGSVTPWGTHLGSEEYEPNAKDVDPVTGNFNDEYKFTQTKYFGLDAKDTKAGAFKDMNVYDYGYQIEVAVDDYENVKAVKHYAMGRLAHELGYVMPNQKTVYISDDGTNVGLFRFEADIAGDLSSGTLYAAKWIQKRAAQGGSADIGWVSLGRASDAEVKHYLDKKVTFKDIFDMEKPTDADKCSTPGFSFINTTTGKECLKVKKGMHKAASRLETRRYAAIKGATTEFRKMEGITLDPETKTMYLAISEVARGMENNMKNGSKSTKYDGGGYNDIKLPMNRCGVVYGLDLDDNYKAQNMYAVVKGKPVTTSYGAFNNSSAYEKGSALEKNKCDVNGISNPDNVTFIPGYNTLIIGEDTGSGHQNDMIWAYDVKSKKLTRIQTTPYGSETTSPYFYSDINGFGYLMSVIQHPYGESDEDKATPGSEETKAYTGYVGPFPAMK